MKKSRGTCTLKLRSKKQTVAVDFDGSFEKNGGDKSFSNHDLWVSVRKNLQASWHSTRERNQSHNQVGECVEDVPVTKGKSKHDLEEMWQRIAQLKS